MNDFEFPTNIKQIGSIGSGLRIYIEDYASSYLQQYAEAGGFEERLAFLVGRRMVIDGQRVLFISGLVQGLYTAADQDALMFTEKSWQHARAEMKLYFKGLDVVGWMQSQPGYGVSLNPRYAEYHDKTFAREDQVLFVIDPAERLSSFYIYDEKQKKLVESAGYFVYYDKNRGMHEYMLDNKIARAQAVPPEVEEAAAPVVREVRETNRNEPARLRRGQMSLRKTANSLGQKKTAGMLLSLSAALFVICTILGAGLVVNNGKLDTLEGQLTEINTAYRDLMLAFETNKTAEVFADSQQPVGQNNQEPVAYQPEKAAIITEDGNDALRDDLLAQASKTPDPTDPNPAPTPQPVAQSGEETRHNAPEAADSDYEEAANELTIPDTYTVQIGDSLSYISLKFYGDRGRVSDIMTLNGIDDPDKIYFGKVLRLPKE